MENNLGRAREIRTSNLGNVWASFYELVSGKPATTSSMTAAPSSQPMKLICDKWRPAGIGLLLTDREQWTALGCQN